MEVISSLIRHSLIAADGANPIAHHFRLERLVGCAGQEMVWKIFQAVRVKDGKEASVFLFEKRVADKLHKPKRREIVTEILRREVALLSRVRHHKILRVVHQLEECNESLAFATEPVLGSLSNLLGSYDRLPLNVQQELKDYKFLDIEIKYGILQIAEAVHHLHVVERLAHLNLSPQSVVVTKKGSWKLAGLGFAQTLCDGKNTGDLCTVHAWSSKISKMAQADLDFVAPEIQTDTAKIATTGADIFSFGLLVCSVYNEGRSLIRAAYNPANYIKELDRMPDAFSEIVHKMPISLVEPIERMTNKDARYRPSMQYFIMLKCFDDAVVHCMQTIDAVDVKDRPEKCDFFILLPAAIPFFPRKLLYNSVLPTIREQLEYPDMLILILPSLLALVENATDDNDYRTIVQPELKKVIAMTRPVQATIYLLDRLEVLLAKATEEETRTEILPMIFNTLESNSIQGQEAAINVFGTIKKYLDEQTLRKLVLPKAKALFVKSTNVRTRLCALECIDRLLDSLDKMMILDDVLPFITEIQCSDVDIIMSIVAIYKHLMSDKKFGLTHNLLATKVMPTLIPLAVAPGLSIDQFSSLMEVLHDMLDTIERQRLSKMLNEMPDQDAIEKRRTSLDMRSRMLADGATSATGSGGVYDGSSANRFLLNVNDGLYSKFRPPSTPELMINGGSQESIGSRPYRRHSSFQGLGMIEQAVLDNIVRQRRASQIAAPTLTGGVNPHILVSEASVSDFRFSPSAGANRRSSTVSTGPVLIPDVGRRDSYGRLIMRGYDANRRSSFQGICETAMQFFGSVK